MLNRSERWEKENQNDSAAGSGERCSKNKAVEILPVFLESKSGRVLKTYNPVYIHKCLKVYGFVQGLFSIE